MRLNLVIADADEAYVDSLVGYIMANYSGRFLVNSFTKTAFLSEYLGNLDKKADILLISPELYSPSIQMDRVKTLIILAGGPANNVADDFETVAKYQHAGKLIAAILNIFSKQNNDEIIISAGNKKTRTIAVYSPAGGCGKTTVALSLCVRASNTGKSVFYLNMEDIPSICTFFDCGGKQNLSDIFFGIKEKSRNLALKIEAVRCTDRQNIHYFLPPDSITEMDEMEPEEIKYLINQIGLMNSYDFLIIDMSCGINAHNLNILKECDDLILVLSKDSTCNSKVELLMKEWGILREKCEINLIEKTHIVLNKSGQSSQTLLRNFNFDDMRVSADLPFIPHLSGLQAGDYFTEINSSFGDSIDLLFSKIADREKL